MKKSAPWGKRNLCAIECANLYEWPGFGVELIILFMT